jgi:hypothetical protein
MAVFLVLMQQCLPMDRQVVAISGVTIIDVIVLIIVYSQSSCPCISLSQLKDTSSFSYLTGSGKTHTMIGAALSLPLSLSLSLSLSIYLSLSLSLPLSHSLSLSGSGKTHTMIGAVSLSDEDEEGVIPRAVRHVFDTILQKTESSDGKIVTNLHVSFIEIYNDECKDLLHTDILPRDIIIREDKEGKIFFTGAREENVLSAEDALEFLDRGNISRTTAETLMNATSSRSHAIFTISIELYEYSPVPGIVNKKGEKGEKGEKELTESGEGGSLIQV